MSRRWRSKERGRRLNWKRSKRKRWNKERRTRKRLSKEEEEEM
jgi:hypothetical protein